MSFQEWQFSRKKSYLFLSNLPLDTFSTFLEQWQYLTGTVIHIETKGEEPVLLLVLCLQNISVLQGEWRLLDVVVGLGIPSIRRRPQVAPIVALEASITTSMLR